MILPGLDRLRLVPKGLAEQGESRYVLSLSGPEGVGVFAVDFLSVVNGVGYAAREGHALNMLMFPLTASWALYDRRLFDVETFREHFIRQKADAEAATAFAKELYPEGDGKATAPLEHPGFCL